MDIRPEALLPLPAATFHILVALSGGDRHGYALLQEIADHSGGEVRLTAATLYRSIQRMLDQRLIAELRDRPAPDEDDERRRYYRITPLGRLVASAEARRLGQMVSLARKRGLGPERS